MNTAIAAVPSSAPRLALTRAEAARALGMSMDSFERYVQPELRLVRRGKLRLIPVAEIERWLVENASRVRGRWASSCTFRQRVRGRSARGELRCRGSCAPLDDVASGSVSPVWSERDRQPIRKTFPSRAAAQAWREDAKVALRQGALRAPSPVTIREAAEVWMRGAKEGAIRNRSGDRYKPSTLRGYERSLQLRVLPVLGDVRLSDLRRSQVQDLADSLLAQGAGTSTIRNTLDPLRAIYRRAVSASRSQSTRPSGSSCRRTAGGAIGSPRRRRPPGCSPLCPRRTAPSGPLRSTPACAAASCAACTGAMSTSTPVCSA